MTRKAVLTALSVIAGLILSSTALFTVNRTTDAPAASPSVYRNTKAITHIGIGAGAKSFYETVTVTVERRP